MTKEKTEPKHNSNEQWKIASDIALKLTNAGHTTYFAGGCVRDALLGKQPKDYDVATSATPDQVAELFPHSDMIGAHFGVVLIKHKEHPVEVATFRTDGSYEDSRRPDNVTFSSPKEDAQRRDFTINGLFKDCLSNEIIDHTEGHKDLELKLIRAIGNPQKRFQEDALRLLRAVRFTTVLDFTIEENTFKAIQENAALLNEISPERIRDEFSRIIVHKNRSRGLDILTKTGLIEQFLPEVKTLIGCEQPPQWHPEGDVYTHTRIALDLLHDDAPLTLCLAVLLHDIAKPPTQTFDEADGRIRFNGHDKLGADMSREILRRLRYSNEIIDDVSEMVNRHMQFMNVQDMRTAKLKRFMARPTFTQELELHRVDCSSSNGFTDNFDFLHLKLEEFSKAPLLPKPFITGNDLIERNLKPGPDFKKILTDAQTEQLEGQLTSREEALQWLNERLK